MGGEKHAYSSVPQKEETGQAEKKTDERPKGLGCRHLQTLLLFVSLTTGYTMRSQLSVSLVAMTNPSISGFNYCNRTKDNFTFIISQDNSSGIITEDNMVLLENNQKDCIDEESLGKWNVYKTYEWDKPTQEMILFAFFAGYTSMMMPAGILAQKYGGKLPILIALAVNGVISIVTPWVPIYFGWVGMCVCRLLQGFTQSAFFPSIHTILGKWAPLGERGRLSTYIYTGSQFGTVLIFQVAGLFAGSPSLGWPSIFWFCGVLSVLCFALYLCLGSATPHEHPTITKEELKYIIGEGSADVKKRKTPWKHILTSPAVWGLVAAHSGSAIGYIMVLTQIPTYMSKVLDVDIKRNGVYSSLPYIAMYSMSLLSGYICDIFVSKKLMSIANIRRAANSIGLVIPSFILIGFGFVSSTAAAVTTLVLCLGIHSGVHVGFHINHIDLAPNFAGPVMALSNMVANLTSLLVPILVSFIIKNDVTNQKRWQILFIVIALFQILTNVIFVIFVRGKVQPWNFHGDEETVKENEKLVLNEKYNIVIKEVSNSTKKEY